MPSQYIYIYIYNKFTFHKAINNSREKNAMIYDHIISGLSQMRVASPSNPHAAKKSCCTHIYIYIYSALDQSVAKNFSYIAYQQPLTPTYPQKKILNNFFFKKRGGGGCRGKSHKLCVRLIKFHFNFQVTLKTFHIEKLGIETDNTEDWLIYNLIKIIILLLCMVKYYQLIILISVFHFDIQG